VVEVAPMAVSDPSVHIVSLYWTFFQIQWKWYCSVVLILSILAAMHACIMMMMDDMV
jgi:hypothetical protein